MLRLSATTGIFPMTRPEEEEERTRARKCLPQPDLSVPVALLRCKTKHHPFRYVYLGPETLVVVECTNKSRIHWTPPPLLPHDQNNSHSASPTPSLSSPLTAVSLPPFYRHHHLSTLAQVRPGSFPQIILDRRQSLVVSWAEDQKPTIQKRRIFSRRGRL